MSSKNAVNWKLIVIAGLSLCAIVAVVSIYLKPKSPAQKLQIYAERFVEIGTAYAWANPDEIDMYWGPDALDRRSDSNAPSLDQLVYETTLLQEEILSLPAEFDQARKTRLALRLQHLQTLLAISQQVERPNFLEEIARLYGIRLSAIPVIDRQENLDALEELLPGRGSLSFRIAAYRNRLLIPAEKRKTVFEAALKECRRRTAEIWNLPEDENIELVWSRDAPAAWHSYQGNGHSVITLNDLSLAFLDSAVNIACHEAYPGHHTQYILRDFANGSGSQNIEDSLVLLRSPEAVLLEGAANLSMDLIFPAQDRIQFEYDVLAKIAGIDTPDADLYLAVQNEIKELEEAILPIVQEYYDGKITFNAATLRLEREAIISSPSALLEYIDEFGTYSAGYILAKKLLREQIARLSSESEKWGRLLKIVTNPVESAKESLQVDIH